MLEGGRVAGRYERCWSSFVPTALPTTLKTSSGCAALMPSMLPKACRRALRRLGPMPGMSSRALLRVLLERWRRWRDRAPP